METEQEASVPRPRWRVLLPWFLLAIVVLAVIAEKAQRWYTSHCATERLLQEATSTGLRDMFRNADYLGATHEFEVQTFDCQISPGDPLDHVLWVRIGPEHAVMVTVSDNTTVPDSVVIVRNNDHLVSVSARDGVFPAAFGMMAQNGPDAGYELTDLQCDGVYDLKLGKGEGYTRDGDKGWVKSHPPQEEDEQTGEDSAEDEQHGDR